MTQKKNTDRHEAAEAQSREGLAATIGATAAAGRELTDEQREAAERQAAATAEMLRRDNAGTDSEQAAGGFVRAGEKNTGVDPIEGDAFAVTQGQKADLVRQGEAENERTLAQQKAAKKTAPARHTNTAGK